MTSTALIMIENPCAHDADSADLRTADAAQPQVRVTDLGINRGDGIFEVVSYCNGSFLALDDHLGRFARSARMLDLPEPTRPAYEAAVRQVAATLEATDPGRQIAVKFIMTRGQEVFDKELMSGWALAFFCDDAAPMREGISVVTLDRGLRSDVAQTSPWLLAGAKSLAYAVNKAVLREAERRGAQDVIFTSTDGYVLEGPSSSVIARIEGTLVTPPPEDCILPGTTQHQIFAGAKRFGVPTMVRQLKIAELDLADALWLSSSTRLMAPVAALNGRSFLTDLEFTRKMNDFLLAGGDNPQ